MKKKYECPWCDHLFEKDVEHFGRQISPQTGMPLNGAGKKSTYSTQVRCPACNRLIKTWQEMKTENVVGRKRIKLR